MRPSRFGKYLLPWYIVLSCLHTIDWLVCEKYVRKLRSVNCQNNYKTMNNKQWTMNNKTAACLRVVCTISMVQLIDVYQFLQTIIYKTSLLFRNCLYPAIYSDGKFFTILISISLLTRHRVLLKWLNSNELWLYYWAMSYDRIVTY